MPSARRLRLVTLAAVLTVVFVLFYASGFGGSGQSADFYHKTMDAMHGRSPGGQTVINAETGLKTGHIPADRDGDGDIDEDDHKQGKDLQQQMTKLAQEAKDNANKKAGPRPDAPSKLVGVGNSAEGNRKPVDAKEDAKKATDAEAASQKGKEKERVAETPAEQAFYSILKKGPGTFLFSSKARRYAETKRLTMLPSRHLLQDVLPVLEARQGHPPGEVPHQPQARGGRARRAPAGPGPAGRAAGPDGPPHGAQRPDQRGQHRRRRRHCRARQRRPARQQDPGARPAQGRGVGALLGGAGQGCRAGALRPGPGRHSLNTLFFLLQYLSLGVGGTDGGASRKKKESMFIKSVGRARWRF